MIETDPDDPGIPNATSDGVKNRGADLYSKASTNAMCTANDATMEALHRLRPGHGISSNIAISPAGSMIMGQVCSPCTATGEALVPPLPSPVSETCTDGRFSSPVNLDAAIDLALARLQIFRTCPIPLQWIPAGRAASRRPAANAGPDSACRGFRRRLASAAVSPRHTVPARSGCGPG